MWTRSTLFGGRNARLELMSHHEPSVWLQDHAYEIDGKKIERKAGEHVGTLMAEWRQARRLVPSLFYKDASGPMESWRPGHVRVWSQEKATEDSLIATWLSDLNRETYEFQLVSTDCVASEHTDVTKARKFANN